jgi:hypothetical protein
VVSGQLRTRRTTGIKVMRSLEYAAAYWERGHPCPLSAYWREKAFR